MCDVSKFNNTNNFITLYLRICFFALFYRFSRLFANSMRKRELVKCIKWPHDSTWVLFELVLCCLVADVIFVVVVIIITLHTKNHLWWPYVIGSITLHFSSFSMCSFVSECVFSLLRSSFILLPFYCCHFIFVVDFFNNFCVPWKWVSFILHHT